MYRKYTILIIGLFFIVRLIFTTQPPVEFEHTWRQATGLMYARNFVETDANFFHPRIDDNAGGEGILILEAPILYYGMYLLSIPLGYQDWYGRLLNLIVSSMGLYYFFLIVRRFFTPRIACYATMILTTSIWLIFSRKTMQDTIAVSFLLMALHLNFNYFKNGRWRFLLGYTILATLGMLAKIPAVMYLFFPMIYLFRSRVDKKRIAYWIGATVVPLGLTALWYFGYAPYASEQYGYWHNIGESFPEGIWSLVYNSDRVLERFFFQSTHSFVFLILFLSSWIHIIWNKKWDQLVLFGGFSILFGFYMIRSGTYFVQHNYYMIPYLPMMALMIALVLVQIPKKQIAIVLLLIGMAEGIVWQVRDFTNSPREEYKMKLTRIMNEYSTLTDKIVLLNNGNPIGFYFTNRKGWLESDENKLTKERLLLLNKQGAKILIINRRHRKKQYQYPILYEDRDFCVYKLEENT